eukprot:s32_g25.t1
MFSPVGKWPRNQSPFTPCFSLAREDRFKGKVEAIYAVEMKQLRRGFAAAWVSPESHLDALLVNTGVARICSRMFQAVPRSFKVEWHSWPQWHPESEPGARASVNIFGVPWHLSMQLGVIDRLLFNPSEPLLKHQVPTKLPPERDVKTQILERAMTFGLKDASVKARPGGFQLETQKKDIMPDPFTATRGLLEPFLVPLLQENPGEEEACLKFARWKFALQQRQSYLQHLPRPGYGNDLPFYSVVEPLKPALRCAGCLDDAPITPVPYSLAHPPVEEFHLKLREASRPAAKTLSVDVQEFCRIQLVKSVKMSLAMPVQLWCAEIEIYSEEDPSAPLEYDWVEVPPETLRVSRWAAKRRWPCDAVPYCPYTYGIAQPGPAQIIMELRKLLEDSYCGSVDEREASRISIVKSVKQSFDGLAEGELVLWSWSCEEDIFSESETSPDFPPLTIEMLRWHEVEPSTLREHFHHADEPQLQFEPCEGWVMFGKDDTCFEAGDSHADPTSDNEADGVTTPWNSDFSGEAWSVFKDHEIFGANETDCQIPDKSSSEKFPLWITDSGEAWESLPDGVIAADSEVQDPSRFWEWTDELRRKRKLPATWNNVQLVPEDYTPEAALEKWHQRCEEYRAQRERLYEELARFGESLVQWPSQGFWPKVEKTARFKQVMAMLDLRHSERRTSACKLEFKPKLRSPRVTPRGKSNPNRRRRSIPETCHLSSFGPQVLSKRVRAPRADLRGSPRRFQWVDRFRSRLRAPGDPWGWHSSFGPQDFSRSATAPRATFTRGLDRFQWVERCSRSLPGPGAYCSRSSFGPQILSRRARAPKEEKRLPPSLLMRPKQPPKDSFTISGFWDSVEPVAMPSCSRRQEVLRREVETMYEKRYLKECESYIETMQRQAAVLRVRAERTHQQDQDRLDKLAKVGEQFVFRFWAAAEDFPKQETTEEEKSRFDRKISRLSKRKEKGGACPANSHQDRPLVLPDVWEAPAGKLKPCHVYVRRCNVWLCISPLEDILTECKTLAARLLGDQTFQEAGISREMVFAMVLLTFDFQVMSRESNFFTALNRHLGRADPNFLQACRGYLHYLMTGLSRMPPLQVETVFVEDDSLTCYRPGHVGTWLDFKVATRKESFVVPPGARLILRVRVAKDESRSRNIQQILSGKCILLPNFRFQVVSDVHMDSDLGTNLVDLVEKVESEEELPDALERTITGAGMLRVRVVQLSGAELILDLADGALGSELLEKVHRKTACPLGAKLTLLHDCKPLALSSTLVDQGFVNDAEITCFAVQAGIATLWRSLWNDLRHGVKSANREEIGLSLLRLSGFANLFDVTLPKTVQKLELNCDAFLDVTWPAKLKCLTIPSCRRTPLSQVVLPHSLENLAFGDNIQQSLTNVRLPASLCSLAIGGNHPLGRVTFPVNLQILTFGARFNQSLEGVVLPKGLRSLTFGDKFNQTLEGVKLPRSLQSLTFGNRFNQSLKDVLLPATLQSLIFGSRFKQSMDEVMLPPKLQEVAFGQRFSKPFASAKLPASLRRLTFCWIPEVKFPSRHIAGLTTLQNLNIEFASGSVRGISLKGLILPAHLRTLTFGQYFNQRLTGLKFPSTLEQLTFGYYFNRRLTDVNFPSGLRILTFGRYFDQPLVGVTFPVALEQLTLGCCFNQRLTDVDFPSGLRILTFGRHFNQPLQGVTFPVALEQMTLGCCFNQRLTDVDFPSGLRILNFGQYFDQV